MLWQSEKKIKSEKVSSEFRKINTMNDLDRVMLIE